MVSDAERAQQQQKNKERKEQAQSEGKFGGDTPTRADLLARDNPQQQGESSREYQQRVAQEKKAVQQSQGRFGGQKELPKTLNRLSARTGDKYVQEGDRINVYRETTQAQQYQQTQAQQQNNVRYTPVSYYNDSAKVSAYDASLRDAEIQSKINRYESKYGSLALSTEPNAYISTTTVSRELQEYTKGKKTRTREYSFTDILFGNPDKVASKFEGKRVGAFGVEASPEFSKQFAGQVYSGLAPANIALVGGAGSITSKVAGSSTALRLGSQFPKLTKTAQIGGGLGLSGLAVADVGYSVLQGDYGSATGKVTRDFIGFGVFTQGQRFQRTLGRTPTIPESNIRDVTSVAKLTQTSEFDGVKTYDVNTVTEVQTNTGYGFLGRKKSFYVQTKGDITTTPFTQYATPEYTVQFDKPKGVLFTGNFNTRSTEGFILTRSAGLGTNVKKPSGTFQISGGVLKEGSVPTKFKVAQSQSFKAFRTASNPSYDVYFGRFKIGDGTTNLAGTQYTFIDTGASPTKDTPFRFFRAGTRTSRKSSSNKPFEWLRPEKLNPVEQQLALPTQKASQPPKVTSLSVARTQTEFVTGRTVRQIPTPEVEVPVTYNLGFDSFSYAPISTRQRLVQRSESVTRQSTQPAQSQILPQRSELRTIQAPRSRQRRTIAQIPQQINLAKQKSGQLFSPIQITAQQQKQQQQQIQLQTKLAPPITPAPVLITPVVPPPILPPFRSFGFSERRGTTRIRAVSFSGYVPDYTSIITGRRGKKFTGISTGFETRPIPRGFSLSRLRLRRKKKRS